MATLIYLEDLQNGYVDLVEMVRTEGHAACPRGIPTIELENATIVVENLEATLPTLVERRPSLMIAALEALQLISGLSTPDLIVAASPAFANYREVDGQFWGAYGERVHNQVQSVVNKLHQDPDSRQAVLTLWDPALDNTPGKKDYPCTVAMNFRIRNGALNLSVVMRSNDVWLGTTYDIFQFTQLQMTVARMLQVDVGTYAHTAWSLHIYERDLDAADQLRRRDDNAMTFTPTGLPNTNIAGEVLLRPGPYAESSDANLRWFAAQSMRAHQKLRGE